MKGLLLKDTYMLWRYMKLFLIMIPVLLVVSLFVDGFGPVLACYAFLFLGVDPVSLLNLDERQGWDVYAMSLPCSRTRLVSAKYLWGALTVSVSLAVYLIAYGAVMFFRQGGVSWMALLGVAAACLTAGLLTSAVCLPFNFALGGEKGRIAYICFFMLITFSVSSVSQIVMENGEIAARATALLTHWYWIIPLMAAVYALSWGLSVLLYKRREL